jgi:hypothetical protein
MKMKMKIITLNQKKNLLLYYYSSAFTVMIVLKGRMEMSAISSG